MGVREITKNQDNLNIWLKPNLNKDIKEKLETLYENERNYELIFESLDHERDIEIFLQIAVTIIKKLQSYIGLQKFTIIFKSTLTKLFTDYIKNVKRAISINENLTIELLKIYHNKMNGLRQIIIPSSTLFKVFLDGFVRMKLTNSKKMEKTSQESIFSEILKNFNKESYNYIHDYVDNHSTTKDIDFNYLLFQILNYYEVSRYPCSLLKNLIEIINDLEINPNKVFSEKKLTSKIIRETQLKYSDQIPDSFEAFFEFLNELNTNIRRFSAHRVFDPSCERFEELDDRILDNQRGYSTNYLFLLGAVLSTILNLFNCWSLLFIINYKYHHKEKFLGEVSSLKITLYKSYNLYRGSPMKDYRYLKRKVKKNRKHKKFQNPHILSPSDLEFYIFIKFLNSHLDYM